MFHHNPSQFGSHMKEIMLNKAHQFQLSEIQKAINNFDESLIIGRGTFGVVYRGEVFIGKTPVLAAIKRVNPEKIEWALRFWLDADKLYSLRHYNLVSLIGYCQHVKNKGIKRALMWPWRSQNSYEETAELILVYRYIPNGTLEQHLHGLHTPLSWFQRLEICIDVARELHYLHTRPGNNSSLTFDTGVMHGDVRSSSILLTESWGAKLSDFGLLKVDQRDMSHTPHLYNTKEVFAYLDINFTLYGQVTSKSDVYSFGVLLLEVLCGKPMLDESRHRQLRLLRVWVEESLKKRDLKNLVDPVIRNEISPECLKDFLTVAQRCMHRSPQKRPDMAKVMGILEAVKGGPRGFSRDLHLISEKGSEAFLDWVEQNTLAPSQEGIIGITVAVKCITSGTPRLYNDCMEEVNFLGQLDHPNIVRLLGCCSRDGNGYLLVYEHMGKSLSHFIYGDEPLSWGARLQIMIGVARGLTYLYITKGLRCHFQCTDILLDKDFNAKIGGFRWEKIHGRHRVNGAYGYLNGDNVLTDGNNIFYKDDIFSFGLVLLETIIGRRVNDFVQDLLGLESYEMQTPTSILNETNLKKMMDPRLEDTYSLEGAFKCMTLALRCISISPELKPSRREIMWSLEQAI